MSFGKLYTYSKAPRATMCLYVAALNRLNVEIVEAWPIKVDPSKGGVGDAYLAKFPTGKVPALERPGGFMLYKCIAVTYYRACSAPATPSSSPINSVSAASGKTKSGDDTTRIER